MSCKCKNKNKEFHPCQHGGKCQCGGKCRKDKDNYMNAAGQYEEHKFNWSGTLADNFKEDPHSKKKMIGYVVLGIILVAGSLMLYKQIKR